MGVSGWASAVHEQHGRLHVHRFEGSSTLHGFGVSAAMLSVEDFICSDSREQTFESLKA